MREKPYPKNTDYVVFEDGRIFSVKSNMFLQDFDNGAGYRKVNLWSSNKIRQVYIHRLIAETFIDNPENYKYVDHIDRDKSNNHVSNIRWCSAKMNTDNVAGKPRYSVERVCTHRGVSEKHEARRLRREGYRVMQISRIMGIPRQTISGYLKESS